MIDINRRLEEGEFLVGCFVKTPAIENLELLCLAGFDMICLDSEHASFGRRELDIALGTARALGMPAFVRVAAPRPEPILQALDGGAAGLLVPHVANVEIAEDVARWARFGEGGRGYAGSTRAAGYTTRRMAETLSHQATIFVQIEDPSALEEIDGILCVDGITGAFFGAADMAVGLGLMSTDDPLIDDIFCQVRDACIQAGKPLAGFAGKAAEVARIKDAGVKLGLFGSDQSFLLTAAREMVTVARDTIGSKTNGSMAAEA